MTHGESFHITYKNITWTGRVFVYARIHGKNLDFSQRRVIERCRIFIS